MRRDPAFFSLKVDWPFAQPKLLATIDSYNAVVLGIINSRVKLQLAPIEVMGGRHIPFREKMFLFSRVPGALRLFRSFQRTYNVSPPESSANVMYFITQFYKD